MSTLHNFDGRYISKGRNITAAFMHAFMLGKQKREDQGKEVLGPADMSILVGVRVEAHMTSRKERPVAALPHRGMSFSTKYHDPFNSLSNESTTLVPP